MKPRIRVKAWRVPNETSVEQGDRQSPLRDGGAPVATSMAGPAVTTHFDGLDGLDIPDDLAPPDFLRRVSA